MKFKVGDSVKCVYNDNGTHEYVGQTGKLVKVREGYSHPYQIDFSCDAWFCDAELELTGSNNPKNGMAKIGSMMKRLLDKDTQTLVKAGFINGDLELTDSGKKALDALAFDANKAALVVMAQEALDEAKENK